MEKPIKFVLFIPFGKDFHDSIFIYKGDVFLKRFVKFRGVPVKRSEAVM